MKARLRLLWILPLLFVLPACGGGGGGGGDNPGAQADSNWDSMIWDRSEWA